MNNINKPDNAMRRKSSDTYFKMYQFYLTDKVKYSNEIKQIEMAILKYASTNPRGATILQLKYINNLSVKEVSQIINRSFDNTSKQLTNSLIDVSYSLPTSILQAL